MMYEDLALSRCAFRICVAVMVLAGCGSQPPIGAPGAMPQTSAIATHAQRGKSWMKSGTSNQDLLYYTATLGLDGVAYVYSLPQGELVGQLTGFYAPVGVCVDSAGNVFIVAYSDSSLKTSTIYEYAHGGASPINTLDNPGEGIGCASDPTSGNLAVANISDYSNRRYRDNGDVAIYSSAQGKPKVYYSGTFAHFYFCGYDDAGNLYISASNGSEDELAWMPSKHKSIKSLKMNKQIFGGYQIQPSVQWDGEHMTVSSLPRQAFKRGVLSVYQLSISRGNAKVIGTTDLRIKKNRHRGETWIFNSNIVGVDLLGGYGDASVWQYPKGGRPEYEIRKIVSRDRGGNGVGGISISPAPSR